uniref:Flavonoid 3'-monooxygenase n=1 Tax=Oryza glumipatula TaxID=40148 RepID=A0A0E0B3H3_9ORYZ
MEMELPSWASVLVIVLAAVVFLLATILRHGRRAYRLPPGPNPWPIIGNLNLIGALPHRSIHELSKRYGPLMQLRFGSFPVVVGSSAEMARFFLKSHDIVFTDRPRTAAGKHTTYNYTDILWSPYGAYWRLARKMCVTELFSARRLESFEHIRGEEVRALLRDLHGAAAPVLLRDYLTWGSSSAGNGGGGEGTSPAATPEEFKMMMDELFLLSGVLNIGDFIPWLDWLDLQGYIRRMKRVGKKLDRFMEHVLDEHDKVRRQQGDRFAARDLVDVLLQLADDPNLEVQLRRDNVKALTQDLIAGGTDTSAITVEWAISELLRKPEILAKATEELDRVVGRGRLVTETDMPSLPYVEAIVKETMRVHPVAPLLAPHVAREDASVGGYDIPAGTRVLVNVWTIARDPALWDSPEEFMPERFIGSKIDVKGQDFQLLPFGSGRRMCPGHSLGLKVIQLSLASLLHGFEWRLPDGVSAGELSMEEVFGLSTPRKVPLEVVFKPKLPAHLYTGP